MGWINVDIVELEGMAMNGLVKELWLEDCERPPGWKRIVAKTVEGEVRATGCMEPDAARRNYGVLSLYAKKWGSLIYTGEEVESAPEEE